MSHTKEQFYEAVLDTDRDLALRIAHGAIAAKVSPESIVFDIVIPAMERIMDSVGSDRGTSLAQHFMASQIASEVVEEMIPLFAETPQSTGTVVIGTARGDFHGLGKRIVGGCLKAKMIEVVDIGLNATPERFVEAALEHGAQVIAVSAMMVHSAIGEEGSLGVRTLLRERGLEDRLRIAVGGAPYRFDPGLYLKAGADAWGENGLVASRIVAELIAQVRKP